MIHRLTKFALILIILIVFIGCVPKALPLNEYSNEAPTKFYTNDIGRAQEEIPFTIILPEYLPNIQGEMHLDHIVGTLKEYQHYGEAQILIWYYSYTDNAPLIYIMECNYTCNLGDPWLDTNLEIGNINSYEIVKRVGNDSVYFCFNHEGIYYILGTENITFKQAEKVLESMLKQL